MEPKKPRPVLDILGDLVDTTEELQKNVQKLVELDKELRHEEASNHKIIL